MTAQNKAINTFAIISSLFMIISPISGWIFYGSGFYNIREIIMSFIHIIFTIYVIILFHKKRFRIFGIIVTVLNLLGYQIISIILLLYAMPQIIIPQIILAITKYLIPLLLVFIFAISLYKKFGVVADIINTIILFIAVAKEIKDIIVESMFVPNATYIIAYIIGLIFFLLTVYFMSFFQTPLCNKKERLGSNFMIGSGAFLTIVGFFLVGYGNSINNDVSTQMGSFFDSGKTGTGDSMIVIGVLLAVFGIILLVTGIVRAIQKDKQISEKNNQTVCKKCGLSIESGAKFCSNCGESVSEIKICSKCNFQLSKDAKFCSNCGFSFENNDNN